MFKDDSVIASISDKDSIEYNIDQIARFANIDFSELRNNGHQMFRILNYACFVSVFEESWHMDFSNHINTEDKIFYFYRGMLDEGDNSVANELATLLFEIKENYSPSDGEIEFIPEDD